MKLQSSTRMSWEQYKGEEEEDPRVILDRFEQSLATLKSMVSELLEVKSKEIEACHEGPKKEEKKPQKKRKTKPEIGE
jgi:hypothetical protein